MGAHVYRPGVETIVISSLAAPAVLHPLLASVGERIDAHASALAEGAFANGLAITSGQGQRPIPIAALPVVLEPAVIVERGNIARRLTTAVAKVAHWRLSHDRHSVFDALSPAEQRVLAATGQAEFRLAVSRVDFMVDTAARALEVNTTIPAMQGYSDIAAESWLHTFAGGHPKLPSLVQENGSNTRALFDALQALHEQDGRGAADAIALLCRRYDAQLSELAYLQQRFRDYGVQADIVYPDQLEFSAGMLQAGARRYPLVYRHLFLNRLDDQPCEALERALASGPRCATRVFNPAAPHLEMKSSLAWLSAAGDHPELAEQIGLDAGEVAAIAWNVPFTRQFSRDACILDSGERVADLAAFVAAHPQDFVIKRSWSYGGHDVFVGRSEGSADFAARVAVAYPQVRNWAELCVAAADDRRGGGFVVQRAVASARSKQWLCRPGTCQQAQVTIDYSAYASLGASPDWTGVCRAAASDVVNIVGGGGVVPLLTRPVADQVLAYLGSPDNA